MTSSSLWLSPLSPCSQDPSDYVWPSGTTQDNLLISGFLIYWHLQTPSSYGNYHIHMCWARMWRSLDTILLLQLCISFSTWLKELRTSFCTTYTCVYTHVYIHEYAHIYTQPQPYSPTYIQPHKAFLFILQAPIWVWQDSNKKFCFYRKAWPGEMGLKLQSGTTNCFWGFCL